MLGCERFGVASAETSERAMPIFTATHPFASASTLGKPSSAHLGR